MIAAERTLFEKADGIHGLSRANANDIAEYYDVKMPPERLRIIALGSEDWTIGRGPVVPGSGKAPRLLFVGRLEPRKAIDVVLGSACDVLARYPSVTLDVVGDDTLSWNGGPSYRTIFEADPVAAAIRDRVRFHGKVSDEELRGFYANCDVLVTPSRYESFGLMLVEAMMFSKVVIGARVGGMQEVVEDSVSGFLVTPGDPADLTARLEQVLDDPALRERVGRAARRRYEERFTPDRMAQGVIDFINEIIARRGSGETKMTKG